MKSHLIAIAAPRAEVYFPMRGMQSWNHHTFGCDLLPCSPHTRAHLTFPERCSNGVAHYPYDREKKNTCLQVNGTWHCCCTVHASAFHFGRPEPCFGSGSESKRKRTYQHWRTPHSHNIRTVISHFIIGVEYTKKKKYLCSDTNGLRGVKWLRRAWNGQYALGLDDV